MKSRPENIWVLYGGTSAEREVSLRSGKGITEALKAKGFSVQGFDVKAGPDMLTLFQGRAAPDLVYLGLHGTFGEDGTVQGFLDSLKIPYVGSGVFSSALCFHKGLSKMQLVAAGLPCPFSWDVHGPQSWRDLRSSHKIGAGFFAKNWFIKPAREGSTVGIERYRGVDVPGDESAKEKVFNEQLARAFKFDSDVLIEEWIEGPEITVPVLEGKALPIVEIRPLSHFYDYESKYTKGRTEYFCPAPLSAQNTELASRYAERAFVALQCRDYGRVDMMISAEGPKILEMNTLPGMTETSLVPKAAAQAGMDYAAFLERLVLSSYARQVGAR